MTALPLIIAPNPIFKQKSQPVTEVDKTIKKLMDDLLDTIYYEHGLGIAAPMVGVLKQVVVIDLQVNGEKQPIFMANPQIVAHSNELQVFSEGSLCFPGIAAEVKRPKKITVKFLDYNNNEQVMEAENFFATCIQHEIDYLHGIVFLDHLKDQPVKRNMLLRKMEKFKKMPHHHHQHSAFCNH